MMFTACNFLPHGWQNVGHKTNVHLDSDVTVYCKNVLYMLFLPYIICFVAFHSCNAHLFPLNFFFK